MLSILEKIVDDCLCCVSSNVSETLCSCVRVASAYVGTLLLAGLLTLDVDACEGNVAFNATPYPFLLNKICLNQMYMCYLNSLYFRLCHLVHCRGFVFCNISNGTSCLSFVPICYKLEAISALSWSDVSVKNYKTLNSFTLYSQHAKGRTLTYCNPKTAQYKMVQY